MIAYSIPNDAMIAMSRNGFLNRPTVKIDLFWLRALYALKSWITTRVAKAMVVDLIYAIVSVLRESPSDHPYLYKFHVKTPITMAPMNMPMYVNLAANLQSMMCFFGFLGGLLIMSLSIGSTPNARAGNRSVPMFTERMRTAVSGAGSCARIATKMVANSPMLHEKI